MATTFARVVCIVLAVLTALAQAGGTLEDDVLVNDTQSDIPGSENVAVNVGIDLTALLRRGDLEVEDTSSINSHNSAADAATSSDVDDNRPIKHVDIRTLAKGGKLLKKIEVPIQHKLPDRIPENGYYPPLEFYKEQGLPMPNTTTQPDRLTPCLNLKYHLVLEPGTTLNLVDGHPHIISESLCAPGAITKTYGVAFTWQLSVQAGPDLKGQIISKSPAITNVLDKLGGRIGFAYSWGTTTTTAYQKGWALPQRHPFVLTFKPRILIFNAYGRTIGMNFQHAICSRSEVSRFQVHFPLTRESDCGDHGEACGPAGNYDSCFFLGAEARYNCPKRNLGPTPEQGEQCPAGLYDPRFLDHDGHILP